MHVKAVLIIGDWATSSTTLKDWVLTVGNNSNPLSNQTILSVYSRSENVKVDSWGQNVAIIRKSATAALKIGYIAVFATKYDCNRILLP